MLSFLKKIFGAKPAAETPVPYKVEGTEHFPFPKIEQEADCVKKPATRKTTAKKPVAKKPAAKKPKKV